ncbi:1-propanol dehydrogenase PduQ [Niallia hominis]|uniref:1-propanol dehydrogenase PduQ n=1 Tax=Niallia hominis TaxID=3133173 RepID=A0ABV1F2E4_9BACI
MTDFSIRTKIIFDLPLQVFFSTLDSRSVFIVADPMMEKLGFTKKITDTLCQKKIAYEVFSEVTPDPKVEVIAKGLGKMNSFKPTHLVAIGGGSAIDTAKGMVLSNYKLFSDYQKPTFVAIPSTSGTGSEVTSFTVITNGEDKKPFVEEALIPDIAILDVDLVKSVPPKVSADTGMDVLTHALEAYVSTNASTFTDALAEKTVKLVFENLPKIYQNPNDLVARDLMHKASTLAGMAFTNASLGINHSLAHAIGGTFHLPHGRINAVLMAGVVEYNAKNQCAAEKYQQMAKELGLPAETAEMGVKHLIMAIRYLNKALGIADYFEEVGIVSAEYINRKDQIITLALADACTATNPRTPDSQSLGELYLSFFKN